MLTTDLSTREAFCGSVSDMVLGLSDSKVRARNCRQQRAAGTLGYMSLSKGGEKHSGDYT